MTEPVIPPYAVPVVLANIRCIALPGPYLQTRNCNPLGQRIRSRLLIVRIRQSARQTKLPVRLRCPCVRGVG